MICLHRHGRLAFTLVEILMVVIILGIVSAIVLPQIGNRDDLKAAAATRLVMADLIFAQNRAIATQRTHYIQFINSGSPGCSYQITTALPPSGDADYVLHPVNKTRYIETFGPEGNAGLADITFAAAFNDNRTILAFDALGTPWAYIANSADGTELTTGRIQLTCGAHSLWITIAPFTGEITVQEAAP